MELKPSQGTVCRKSGRLELSVANPAMMGVLYYLVNNILSKVFNSGHQQDNGVRAGYGLFSNLPGQVSREDPGPD